MGSVVGEKRTRLIEYATNRSLPVIIVCASGGARMQEVDANSQLENPLFYVAILTDPSQSTILGEIMIAERVKE